jgi:hypothetical protein
MIQGDYRSADSAAEDNFASAPESVWSAGDRPRSGSRVEADSGAGLGPRSGCGATAMSTNDPTASVVASEKSIAARWTAGLSELCFGFAVDALPAGRFDTVGRSGRTGRAGRTFLAELAARGRLISADCIGATRAAR